MCVKNYVNLHTLVIVFSKYYERNILSTKYETRISASSLNSNFLLSDVLINLKIGVHGSDDQHISRIVSTHFSV